MPICSACKLDKPAEDFWKRSTRPNGLQGNCKVCAVQATRRWREANPERVRELDKRYYDRSGLAKHRQRKYGLSPEEVDEMLQSQAGVCAICKTETATHVDHDHATNLVRAILCPGCNKGLGHFNDDPKLLREAAGYLDRYSISGVAQDPAMV